MATARWFFEREPESRFIIQEHLRQGYWRAGPGKLWVDVVQTTPPYRATGYWHDITFELEWEPSDYLILRSSSAAEELVRATSLQLGFRPTATYEEGGKQVAEWRLRAPVEAPPTPLAATPVVETASRSEPG